jgi:hypothetical protein
MRKLQVDLNADIVELTWGFKITMQLEIEMQIRLSRTCRALSVSIVLYSITVGEYE